ncbi:uncharacterized protein N7482_009347 [Penicillium canariense]|uniref:Homologous-pairing protein 2 winged helix domain-containing protein n=1 Tax=Penicillium canariense TaxID=189055 RepID=A0A9W9HQ76_9EURO|nr:uncharacterized protein N7482_009347 [Penicillium canariense]KAJ5152869.1 hypothetical protein N7482_009347 [Penicillium canariense]
MAPRKDKSDKAVAIDAQAAKVLRELHQKREIEGRPAGKQIVYHALQESSDSTSPEAIAALGQEIEKLQDEFSAVKADEKKARAALAALEAKPRLSALRKDIRRLQEERDAAQGRLGKLSGDGQLQISLEERAQLERDWKQWQRHATVRRRICRELWGRCSEVLPDDTTALELWVSHAVATEVRLGETY